MKNIIYLVPFLFYFTSTASALHCYECDSSKNVACDYGILSFTLPTTDCSSGIFGFIPKTCTKIVAKDKSGSEYIARGCGVNTGIINTCQATAKAMQFAIADDNLASIDCYTCEEDKCNSASTLRAITIVGILTACLLYLL